MFTIWVSSENEKLLLDDDGELGDAYRSAKDAEQKLMGVTPSPCEDITRFKNAVDNLTKILIDKSLGA